MLVRMGWDGFMEMERKRHRERSEGKLRRALGRPLPGESVEQLNRIGEHDRRRAEQGLVAIKEGGKISYMHIDDLSPLDMRFRTAAERVTVEWLKERVERIYQLAISGDELPRIYLIGSRVKKLGSPH